MKSRFVKTDGVVLNSTKFGEGHKIVAILTQGSGKIKASAFGVRKTKSRFGSTLEPFTFSRFLLYRKDLENPFTIRDSTAISHNLSIREDIDKFLIGNAIIEPVVRFVGSDLSDERLYGLLVSTLHVLDRMNLDVDRDKGVYLLSMYDIQFLSVMGYAPEGSLCLKCGSLLGDQRLYMDHQHGFPLCGSCKNRESLLVSEGTLRFVDWSLKNSVSEALKVKMKQETKSNIRTVIEILYEHAFHRSLESWKQLDTLYPTSPQG